MRSIQRLPLLLPCLLLICIGSCGPNITMPGRTITNHYSPVAGVNTANLFLYCPELVTTQNLVADVIRNSGNEVLRFPGGTTANFYHPKGAGYGFKVEDLSHLNESGMKEHMRSVVKAEEGIIRKHGIDENFIHAFSRLAKNTEQQVLFVANLMSGSVEETLLALEIMKSSGVRVRGVELGNEYYLKAYASEFASVNEYLSIAKVYAQAIREVYPDLSISIVAAPVASIKSISKREVEWNKELQELDFYDALSVHFYPRSDRFLKFSPSPCTLEEAIEMGFNQPKRALQELEMTFPGKQIWLTEWNVAGAPKWCNNSVAHSFFTSLMQESISGSSQVTSSIYHTLVSKAQGFNLYNPDKILGLKPLPNTQSLELSLKLKRYLENAGTSWTKTFEPLPENGLQFSFQNERKKTKVVMVYNAGNTVLKAELGLNPFEHWELSSSSLEQGALIKVEDSQGSCGPESINLFLIK